MTATVSSEARQDAVDGVRLHRIMTGYLESKALFSALELGVFDVLDSEPRTVEEVARELGLDERPVRVLLLALLGSEVITCVDGRYANNSMARTFLVSSSPKYMGALAAHQSLHFSKFARLTEALRENKPVREGGNYQTFGDGREWARRMAEVTRAHAHLMSEDLAGAVRAVLRTRRHVVDLGCASGAHSIGFARAVPELRVTAVDQPEVAAVTTEFVAAAGLADRIEVRAADIFTDTFPDCDGALLSNVVQGFDRDRARQLIEHVHGWLPEGGVLLLHTHLPDRATVPFPYLFGLILLVNNTYGGEAHDEESHLTWLREAGFRDVAVTAVSPIATVLRATK